MQIQNLIFALSIAAASLSSVFAFDLTTVLAPSVKGDDFESWKSCLGGNTESCPGHEQFYKDVADYKKDRERLLKCVIGIHHHSTYTEKLEDCKPFVNGASKTLKHYLKITIPRHMETAKKQNLNVQAIMEKTKKMKGIEKQVCLSCWRDSISDGDYGNQSIFESLSDGPANSIMLVETIGPIPYLINLMTTCQILKTKVPDYQFFKIQHNQCEIL